MKPKKTKKELREEIERQVQDFLRSGGEVKAIPRGQSAMGRGELIRPVFHDGKPKETRTPCDDALKAIDSRKVSKTAHSSTTKHRKPKRKVIYDDFGEPIREVWE